MQYIFKYNEQINVKENVQFSMSMAMIEDSY